MTTKSITRRIRRKAEPALALVQIVALLTATSCDSLPGLEGAPGLPQYQERLALPVPGGLVNVAGGNLLVRRVDLSIDTRLGTREIGATYNGWLQAWRWSFDLRYDGQSFVDEQRATYDTSSLLPGDAIPGTTWVVVDDTTLKTKGGLVHEFAATGLLTAVHWSSSAYPRLTYTSALIGGDPHITAIDQCLLAGSCTSVYSISYNGDGRVTRIDDRTGRHAEFSYDADGWLATARDALDVDEGWPGFRYEYSRARLTALTNSEGERVEFGYERSRVTRVTAIGAGDPTWKFSYGENLGAGLYFTRVFDPLGFERIYRYDAERRLIEHENSLGELTLLTWVGMRPASRTDPAGVTTSWTWSNDDTTTETHASGRLIQYSYDANGVNREDVRKRPLLSASDQLGPIESRTYDPQGRLTSVTNGAGEATSFTYDPEENLFSETNPAGVTRGFYNWGEHGHPTQVSVPTVLGELFRDQTYDSVGNLIAGDAQDDSMDPGRPGIVSRSFDADRNVASVELESLPGGATSTLTIEHRSDGQRARILRPYGGDTELDFDALGRPVAQREFVDGVWMTTAFEYDLASRPTASERPNGMRSELDYDAAGRIVAVRHLRNGVTEQTLAISYSAGRVSQLQDSVHGAAEQISYDAAGRPSVVAFPRGEALERDYDLRSRETQKRLRLAGGALLRTLDTDWDGANRAIRLFEDGVLRLDRTISDGRLGAIAYGNGLERTFGWDPYSGELMGSFTVDAAASTVETTLVDREQCSFDIALCVTANTQTFGVAAATTEEVYWLTPFSLNGPDAGRRIMGFGGTPGFFQSATREIDHDALGNWLHNQSPAQPFTYNDEHNRLLAADGHSYASDDAGFVTNRDGQVLTWTASGRIASLGESLSFTWDALGRPVSTESSGVATEFLFGGLVEADSLLQPTAIDLGEMEIRLATSEHRYRHYDFRGNVKFVSDDAGAVVRHLQYSPYGVDSVFGSDDDDRSFAQGQELGDLLMLGARLYDPAAGRFLSPDPIYQLLDQFSYTAGNPVEWGDPDGQNAKAWIGAILFGAGLTAFGAIALSTAPATGAALALAYFTTIVGLKLLVDGASAADGNRKSIDRPPGNRRQRKRVVIEVGGPLIRVSAPPVSRIGCAPSTLSGVSGSDGGTLLLLLLQLLLGRWILRRRLQIEGPDTTTR